MVTVGGVSRCPRCGYERRGLDARRRCPECGGPPPADVGRDAPLDRFDRPTIIAAIRWQVMAIVTQLGVGCLVLSLIAGPGPGAVLLAIGGVAVACGSWVRTNRRLRSPQAPVSMLTMVIGRLGPFVAIVVTAIFGAGGGGGGATAATLAAVGAILLLLQAVFIAREGMALADWSRDDRALGLGDLAVTTAMFAVFVWGAIQLGRLVGAITAVPILDIDGLAKASSVTAALGALCWWLIRTLADLQLGWSVVLCLVHRIEHEDVEDRRFQRTEAWEDELHARFGDDRTGEP